ncbi:hypothetical protein [Microbacterium sp. GXF6406]
MQKYTPIALAASALALATLAGCASTIPLIEPEPTRTWYSMDGRGGGTISAAENYEALGVGGRVLVCAAPGVGVTVNDAEGYEFADLHGDLTEDDDSVTMIVHDNDDRANIGVRPAGTSTDLLRFEFRTSYCNDL